MATRCGDRYTTVGGCRVRQGQVSVELPDGTRRSLVFGSRRAGDGEVHLRDVPAGCHRAVISTPDGDVPTWLDPSSTGGRGRRDFDPTGRTAARRAAVAAVAADLVRGGGGVAGVDPGAVAAGAVGAAMDPALRHLDADERRAAVIEQVHGQWAGHGMEREWSVQVAESALAAAGGIEAAPRDVQSAYIAACVANLSGGEGESAPWQARVLAAAEDDRRSREASERFRRTNYSGYAVADRDALLGALGDVGVHARFPRVVAEHVTHRYPDDGAAPHHVAVDVVGVVRGEGVEALVVEVDGSSVRPDGRTYHITLSLDEGHKPAESNALVAAALEGRGPVLEELTPIRVVVGAF